MHTMTSFFIKFQVFDVMKLTVESIEKLFFFFVFFVFFFFVVVVVFREAVFKFYSAEELPGGLVKM